MRIVKGVVLVGAALAVLMAYGGSAEAQTENKCLAGKIQCVSKYSACLLGVISRGYKTGAVDNTKLVKCADKFDGRVDPTKSCFAKVEAKNDGPCITFGDTIPLEDIADAFVADVEQRLAFPPRVLIVGAALPSYNTDVQSKLVATGAFLAVDVFDARLATPTLAQLTPYQAILVYSDAGFQNPAALGDVVADYFDGGGRVVVTTFANTTAGTLGIQGRFGAVANGYMLINPAAQTQTAEAAPLQIVEPLSPLVAGVVTLTATSGFKSTGGVINGGVVVARWGSGAPLIVRGVKNARNFCALNFYPPSAAAQAGFWVGDGAAILRNALLF